MFITHSPVCKKGRTFVPASRYLKQNILAEKTVNTVFIDSNCYVDPLYGGSTYCLLRLASALALVLVSGLTLRHPLLDFFLGAPKYDPSYIEIIFHW